MFSPKPKLAEGNVQLHFSLVIYILARESSTRCYSDYAKDQLILEGNISFKEEFPFFWRVSPHGLWEGTLSVKIAPFRDARV